MLLKCSFGNLTKKYCVCQNLKALTNLLKVFPSHFEELHCFLHHCFSSKNKNKIKNGQVIFTHHSTYSDLAKPTLKQNEEYSNLQYRVQTNNYLPGKFLAKATRRHKVSAKINCICCARSYLDEMNLCERAKDRKKLSKFKWGNSINFKYIMCKWITRNTDSLWFFSHNEAVKLIKFISSSLGQVNAH